MLIPGKQPSTVFQKSTENDHLERGPTISHKPDSSCCSVHTSLSGASIPVSTYSIITIC